MSRIDVRRGLQGNEGHSPPGEVTGLAILVHQEVPQRELEQGCGKNLALSDPAP